MSSQRPSPCTSNESPNADISTLESGSQSPSPPSAPDRFPHTASKSPSQPMLNTPWFDSGVLSYKGSLNLNLPVEVSNIFLNMFMQRRSISGFELHIDRVIRSFQPRRSDAPVPALLYTILLLGCHFIPDPELKFWESVLFERAKLEIDANITRAHANDSKDIILYIIYTRVMGSSKRKMGRWSPRDSVELGEAINLWWACFERDYGGSLINGLPPSISLKDIKTGWPVALADFEAVDVGTLASLLDIRYYHAIGDVSQDSSNCILAKCVTLVHCAGMLDTERISGSEVTDEWWARFEECDRAIDIFTTSVQRAYVNRDIQEVAIIALSHTAVDSATIQLHGPLADYKLQIGAQGDPRGIRSDNSLGGYSYTRCIEACRSIALITAYIENIDINHMQMFFGVSLSCAAQVLAKQIPRLRESGHTAQAQEMERQISVIAKSMESYLLSILYSVSSLMSEHL
ncbi:GAL4-like Zn(II)2Cys6 (or C6 zinc) binuclear cluster DNA-binding domain [Rhizoctonia solani]|uniref:GAL4-like Zn(II)2Cys6 (Or C6 zinc) binuclear cluster DNA-binding domain n=1 Tax=Rhizoctonia solani TaxID=456999 RepID=A0A8H7IEQ1_9AGAM|nr:GAL4-like Zn(II)2Cys6 (or C6 zinc) binuclear cluster DNA-binding domain [Rhizoctonia solani]